MQNNSFNVTISDKRRDVEAEARTWKETPFAHQADLKGVGVDCGMLIIRVGEACGVLQIDDAAWKPFAGYGRAPNPRKMREALETFMVEIEAEERQVGDVVWLEWREDLPMHLAIFTEMHGRELILHAKQDLIDDRFGKVIEHGYVAEWPGRANSFWRYPGLVEV